MFRMIGGVILLGSFLLAWAWMEYEDTLTTPAATSQVYLEIARGDSLNRIIEKLQEQGVRIKPLWLKLYAYRSQSAQRLKAGDYEINEGSTVPDILALFVSGKTRQYSITFPEGWTFSEIMAEIKKNPYLKHRLTDDNIATVMSQIGVEQKNPEGLFFPDTYFFEKHTTDVALLKRAYDQMQLLVQHEWQQRKENLPLTSPYQALILASIIEKETGMGSERRKIGGVFTRRLKKGMRLQTDPTVIYGMGAEYNGDIRSKDLKKATPYNTYVIKGLPPTPIAMPGKEAIHAALNPESGESLYFVARGDGGHVFTANLKDHNQAVRQYQIKPH